MAMLRLISRKEQNDVILSVWATCQYCKANFKVDLAPNTEPDTILIPCYKCWKRYEGDDPLPIPHEILFATNRHEAEVAVKQVWLDLDVPEPDFRYFKKFVADNF